MASAMAAGTATMPTTPGWASRCVRPATTPKRRCCGTPSLPSCGGGPPSPSSVPLAGWSASGRGSCAAWSGSYAKVAEFQRRGAIHFHAVIRLDAATDCRCPGCLAPPAQPFTATLLEDALRLAVPAVRVPCPSLDGGPERYARWGEQLDVRNITRDEQAEELSAEQVAGYIAKYATKATESFGSGLDRRIGADDLEQLDKLPAHVAELVRAAWELGGRPELEGLRLRAWAHMLGFRGHWSTKSRRYSTTFTALRR